MVKKIIILLVSIHSCSLISLRVSDSSNVYHSCISHVETPKTISELQELVKNSTLPLSVAGSKYSMGGQVWCPDGIMIDMKKLHAITAFDPEGKTITVQTGTTWKHIQDFLLPHNLTVKVMQSYNDFSVGGSLAVNVHGRSPYGSLISTVQSFRIMLADGSIVTASRTENSDLFAAAIGGYGALGIIVDVTLQLEDNYKIKRYIKTVAINDFVTYFNTHIKNNDNVAFFNGNIYGPSFDKVIAISWNKTDQEVTNRSLSQNYVSTIIKRTISQTIEYALSKFKSAQYSRLILDEKIGPKISPVVWRSYEMSYTVKSLAPHSSSTSHILQEYFIPVHNVSSFINKLKSIVTEHNVAMINVSLRHVPVDTESLLSYAPQESFACVCYMNIENTPEGIEHAQTWTQRLIGAALNLGGTYYLPYHLFGTPGQFLKAYTRFPEFLKIKEKYDPENRFQNSLLQKYSNY